MIRNIVFDIGNVLVDFCWRDHIAGLGFSEAMVERLGAAMMLHPVWNEIDRGVWTEEELLQAFIRNAPELEQEIRLVFSDLRTVVRERPGSKTWIRELKAQGYRIYYLSNFSEKVGREAADQLTFLKEMDGGVFSCRVKLIKPDPAIYQVLFDQYGLKPEECVFLDDTEPNIRTARELGMEAIQVFSQEQAREDLQNLLKKGNNI